MATRMISRYDRCGSIRELLSRSDDRCMSINSRHVIFAGIILFLVVAFVYAHVIKPLQLNIRLCELAQSIDDECKADERACERDTMPSFKKMLDACEGLPVDWGGDDDDD